MPKEDVGEEAAVPLQPPSAVVPLIRKVLSQYAGEDGWVALGAVGTQLSNLSSDFDPRTYGYRKLSDLVKKTGQFEVEGAGATLRIRRKVANQAPATQKK
jgi:hypothetical protein